MKQNSTIFIIFLIFANAAAIFAQRPITNTPPAEPKLELIESTNPMDTFSKKGLPAAYIIGQNRSDELAEWLAKEISKYDKESLPIMIAALQKAGFYIIDQNQKILYKPTSTYDMEMSFYDFEVVGMLKISAMGTTTTIKKLAEVISQNNRQIPADKLGASILDDLRKAKNSKDMRIRFVAKLIFEIGKNSSKPVDLGATTPENSTINIIQASLIERILLGDLMDSYAKLVAGNDRKGDLFRSNTIRFINADFLSSNGLCDSWDDLSTLQNTSKNAYKISEKFSIFEKTLDECELLGDKKAIDECKARKANKSNNNLRQQFLESFGKGLRLVIISLASNKLKSASQTIKIDLKVQEPMPLVRTKSSSNLGETRDVTAKFTLEWADAEKAVQVGCLDKLAADSNPKFDILESPSLEGKTVEWAIVSEDGSEIGDDSVTLSSQTDKLKGQTGESLVSIVGKSQKEDLTNRKTYATPHAVYLSVYIEENFATLGAKSVRVPIRDWIPCTDDWSGTIDYEREYEKTTVIKSTRQSNGNGSGDGIRTYKFVENAIIKLNPRKPEEMKTKPPNPADMEIFNLLEDIFEGVRENDPCCGKEEGSFTTRFRKGRKEWFTGMVKGPISIKYQAGERDFSLGFSGSTGSFKLKEKNIDEVFDTNCPLEELTPIIDIEKVNSSFDMRLEDGRYGQRFVGTAGEVLFGTKILNPPDGTKITWKWNLYRCRD